MSHAYPIVFLPGLMGTRLHFPRSGRFWDPDSYRRMLPWLPVPGFPVDDANRREFHHHNSAQIVRTPLPLHPLTNEQANRGWGEVVWSFYGDFLRHLSRLQDHADVSVLGYDWRQDVEQLGDVVSRQLRELAASKGAPLRVVTHSMGSLVLRAALELDGGLRGLLHNVVYICPPSTGAVVLYRRLFTGMDPVHDQGAGFATRLILGGSRRAFVGNLSGMPGPFALLPSAAYPPDGQGIPWHPALGQGTPHAGLYGHADSPPGVLDGSMGLPPAVEQEVRDRLVDVDAIHALLGDPAVAGQVHPRTHVLYGTGVPTETAVGVQGSTILPNLADDGDGTVPAVSASALRPPNNPMHPVQGLDHGYACRNSQVQQLVASLL